MTTAGTRSCTLATFLFLSALWACGDSTSAPPAVGSVSVSPTSADLRMGETQQLAVTVSDADGNHLTDRTVTWSSDQESVATVSSSGLVEGVSEGTAKITATAEGKSGSATINVTLPSFNPTADASIAGSIEFAEIHIRKGVTVTAVGPAMLSATGVVDIQGDLVGDCVGIGIAGQADMTIAGDISNDCSGDPGDAPPALTLVANGDLTLDAGELRSSGDVEISNDPTLGDSDFPTAAGEPIYAAGAAGAAVDGTCIVRGRRFTARGPVDGKDGQKGTAGKDGHTWTLSCRGNMDIQGNVSVTGQDGGEGGDGTHTSNTAAQADGGNGGEGGKIRVRATGDISFSGSGNTITSGVGGNGGSAVATATANQTPAQAPGAVANAGDGGKPGLIEVRANGSISIDNGSLTLIVGEGGNGGAATATGADGADASVRGDVAQAGGDATAMAGDGADTPDKKLGSSGAVVGLGNVDVQGGDAGSGGKATAHAGKGGSGDDTHPPGAAAGSLTAQGGKGGNAELKDQNDALIGTGGNGGDAVFEDGTGGNGAPQCPDKPGGAGGKGASADGMAGTAGTGAPAGTDGTVTVNAVGNGGNGGDGNGPGAAGAAGDNGIKPAIAHAGSFQPGKPGNPCAPPAPPKAGTYNVVISVTSDPSNHEPFIGMPSVNMLTIAIDESNNITITGASPFTPLTGTIDPATGAFMAMGTGTFADGAYPDIKVTLSGTITCESGTSGCTNTIDATMNMTNFPPAFPEDINYKVTGTQKSG